MLKRILSAATIGVCVLPGFADSFEIPEEPLSLVQAVGYANNSHPSGRDRELVYELAQDTHQQLKSGNRLDVRMLAVPQRADRAAEGLSNSIDDSYARLEITYPLIDFGRKNAAVNQAATELDLAKRSVDHSNQQRRLEIMKRFFDVLIADLDYGVKNEKMTLAFLRFNRFREEMDIYQAHSEVDVLGLETIYRDTFFIRQQAGIEQLTSRRQLGMAMGSTDYVPRDLLMPNLSAYVEREVPEFEDMLEQALANSQEMVAANLQVERAQLALEVVKKRYQPSVEARLEATEWNQEIGSRNSASIGIQVEVPLVSGTRKSRDSKRAMIDVERAKAKLAEVEHELRTRVLDLWKKVSLHHVDLAAARVRSDYRDQYMDRARTLYELEEVADLGDAQAEQLRAYLELKRVEFELTLAWSEFDMLAGVNIHPN